MNRAVGNVRSDSLFFGIALIGAGVILLLHQLEVAEIGRLVRGYWPLFIVFMGAGRLFNRDTVWSGLWLLALGCWLQMVTLRLFGLTYRNSWPVLLIVVGAGSVVRALIDLTGSRRGSEDPDGRR